MIRILRDAMSRFELVDDADSWDRCVEPGRMLPLLVQFPRSRKPRLLACAYLRYAPFELDGKPIWDLLPGYRWFELPRGFRNSVMPKELDLTIDGTTLTCHSVIEIAEARADGRIGDEDWSVAEFAARRAEWSAEADTFNPDLEVYVRSRLREAAAGLVHHATADDWDSDADRLIKYLLLWPVYVSRDEPDSIHKGNGASLCQLIRDLYGNPFRPLAIRREWVSESAREMARMIYEDRAFDLMPVLGDALEESGVPDGEVLRHCRDGGSHARGCWAIDEVADRVRLPPFRPDQIVPWLELIPEHYPRQPEDPRYTTG